MNIPDNYDMWEAHEREKEKALANCLVCEDCKHPIQEDFFYEVEGEILCEECMERRYRKDAIFE